jgi:hypothetical protein
MSEETPISTEWRIPFDAAQRETNPQRLSELIAETQNAIFYRWQDLNDADVQERNDIKLALETIREWQVSKLNFPRLKDE